MHFGLPVLLSFVNTVVKTQPMLEKEFSQMGNPNNDLKGTDTTKWKT